MLDRRVGGALLAFLAACSAGGTPPPAPASDRAPPSTVASAAPAAPAAAPAQPSEPAPAPVPAPGARDAGAGDASEAPPRVKVITIGMHVGGGPYDEITKEPMRRSVEPRFSELAACWRLVARPRQADFGVDLLIEAKGGLARVSNPRTTIDDTGFTPCVVTFFEGVDFQPPRNGRTVVSYSVRFTP